jgi:hypothetical protein
LTISRVRHQPHAVNPLAVNLDELAGLVCVDGPGNAVGEKPASVFRSLVPLLLAQLAASV